MRSARRLSRWWARVTVFVLAGSAGEPDSDHGAYPCGSGHRQPSRQNRADRADQRISGARSLDHQEHRRPGGRSRQEGQLLATLDPTFAAADVEQLSSRSRAGGPDRPRRAELEREP